MKALSQTELLQRLQNWQPTWPTPFVTRVHTAATDRPLVVEKVLRQFPGRRIVAKGQIHNRPVLLKIGPKESRGSGQDFAHEAEMSRAIAAAGVDTPALVDLLTDPADEIEVLIYDFIPAADTLLELGSQTSAFDRFKRGVEQAIRQLSRLHASGFIHEDPHLGNFLYAEDQLFMIDCADIACCSDTLAQQRNLVLLLAQLPPQSADEIRAWIQCYEDNHGILSDAFLQSLPSAVNRQWWRRTHKYLRKIQRNCSEIVVKQNFWQRTVYKRHLDSMGLGGRLIDPESMFEHIEWLKKGNSASVGKVSMGGKSWVIKRYNIKSLWHWVRRCFRKSRAWHSWHNAHLLKRLQVATPAPIGYVEKRCGPLRRQAYYICEFVDAEELSDTVAKRVINETEKCQLSDLFATLSSACLYHSDFKARNILSDGEQLYLIDLDAMSQWQNSPKKAARLHAKDLERFLDNRCFDANLRQELTQLLR